MEKIKEICRVYQIKPSKGKGQNFLINPKVLERIVSAAELKKEDEVLEIGPGFGILTEKLVEKVKKVIAVEIDKKLVEFLKGKFKNYKNIKIIEGDILKIGNWKLEIGNLYKVVANLPYNITGVVLRKFLSGEPKPSLMILMLQKEVAERIVEKNKKSSIISLMVNFYGQPEIISYVSKNNFWPRPKVDSALLRIALPTNYPATAGPRLGGGEFQQITNNIDEDKFFQLIKIGFSSPRKQLVNNLGKIIEKEKLKETFTKLKINPKTRAEDLTLENWLDIYRYLHAN